MPWAAASSSGGGGYKTVSQSEWDEMQREVRNVRSLLGVGDGESLVGSDAHARLRAELEEARKEGAAHAKNEERLKEDLAQEAVYRDVRNGFFHRRFSGFSCHVLAFWDILSEYTQYNL